MKLFFVRLSSLLILSTGSIIVKAQQDTLRIPHSPLSFLRFAPDARGAAMGEAGVASSADANSTFWNAAKLPYNEKDFGVSASYTPWLRNLIDDMWLGYLSAYKKIDKTSAVALSVNYFSNGELDLRDAVGTQMGYFTSKEFAISGTYSRQLGKNFSMGLTLKWINSDLTGNALVNNVSLKPARTFAGDISAYYRKELKNPETGGEFTWSLGGVISNLGGKVSYGGGADYENFLPTNLRLGGGLSFSADGRNKFNFVLDAVKLMVPTPDGTQISTKGALAGAFGSFSDAPDGFSEELKEVALAVGAEYWYNNIFALRGGYYGENKVKGNNKFFTAGAGLRFKDRYAIDFAYLFPVTQNSPLAQTLRITLGLYLNKAEKLDVGDSEN
ncbi:hypothetical protein DYBT9275_00117 [Dyadobacter sp. CECT 9275]|uniref:Type IX secretion system protein PorV domain-containing protein n=1 Tax=Dyadobacter helix TaxID=2822344 RepID=A0A916J6F9_9BACT|nr:type IX secretion system outer membrane channel protein PorV [Dyadobacter sp. CECT 9275]CAG4988589.1 hypothetical protein DYBT9275_00117 [Dyadobacter sp. CECT 9275]